jgi:hypothetical protein
MLRCVVFVRTYGSDEHIASVIKVKGISEIGAMIAVTSNQTRCEDIHVVASSTILVALIMEAILCTETSVLTRATRHNILEDGILYSHTAVKI